ncbi:MAG TPA: hypothetical protein EYG91_00320 [Aquifex aeolicus]|nr:hypothetical protein [Aquifex aeolicus]
MFGFIQKHKRLGIFLIALASFSFLFWMFSVSDVKQMFAGSSCVATVKNECITIREYRFELLKYANLLENANFRPVVKRLVLNSLITREVLYQKAKELGWFVSDEEIIESIKNNKLFKEEGKFSLKKYKEVLNRFNLTPEEYEEILRKSLMALKVMNFINYGVYVLPDEIEIQKVFRTAYFDGKLYLISSKDVKVDYEPTEQEIRKYYEENKEKFREKEKRLVYVWVLEDKGVVQDYYKLLKEGKIPEGYKELSEVSLPQRVKDAANQLNESNRLKLIKEKDSYYILFFKERQKPKLKPLDEVREEIRDILITRERERSLERYSKEVKENLIKGEKVDIKPLKVEKASLDEISRILRIEQKDILELLFGKEKVFGPFVALNGYGILVIDKRGFKELDEKKIDEIEKKIKETKFQDIIGFYVDSLIKQYKVKVNEGLLNRF